MQCLMYNLIKIFENLFYLMIVWNQKYVRKASNSSEGIQMQDSQSPRK
jgi:hypothetical protein